MVNNLLQSFAGFAGVTFNYSTQHQDISKSGVKRDEQDIKLLLDSLKESSPFAGESKTLRSIATGVSAANNCNVDDSKAISLRIIESMKDKSVAEFSFKKKDKAQLMSSKSAEMKNRLVNQLDLSLLFQRCITLLNRLDIEEKTLFHYELCS